MSFWRCPDPQDNIALHEVALALVAGPRHLSRISLVWLAEEQLVEEKFELQDSKGRTLVEDPREQHVDVKVLTAERFFLLAQLLQNAVRAGHHDTVSENQLRTLLLTAIRKGRLPVDQLKLPLLVKLLDGLEGSVRPQAEQHYLHEGLAKRLQSFHRAAAWYDLNLEERGRLSNLVRQVQARLKEANRPEAAPDGVDLLRAVQERGQPPRTVFSVLEDSIDDSIDV